MKPEFSVLLPAHNERSRIASTIQSIARARTTSARVEFVVVDDASTDDCVDQLTAAVTRLLEERAVDIRVCRLPEHSGTYRARNEAAALASADILVITDAHVRFSHGWDRVVLEHLRGERILAGTVTQAGSTFKGYGCSLLVPLMGTSWNCEMRQDVSPVAIAVCAATVLPRALFHRLGGYDDGMVHYGAGEPEFSVRAWLHGAEIYSVAHLEVEHEFKPRSEFTTFINSVRVAWVHNCLRFGLLYLSELGSMQMLRFYARAYPAAFASALALVQESDVWDRRALLEEHRQRPFDWFVQSFGLTNQIGGPIL